MLFQDSLTLSQRYLSMDPASVTQLQHAKLPSIPNGINIMICKIPSCRTFADVAISVEEKTLQPTVGYCLAKIPSLCFNLGKGATGAFSTLVKVCSFEI